MILSSSLALVSMILLGLSVAGFYIFGNPLVSFISFLGIGFFGTLTALHLIARRARERVKRRIKTERQGDLMKQHSKSRPQKRLV